MTKHIFSILLILALDSQINSMNYFQESPSLISTGNVHTYASVATFFQQLTDKIASCFKSDKSINKKTNKIRLKEYRSVSVHLETRASMMLSVQLKSMDGGVLAVKEKTTSRTILFKDIDKLSERAFLDDECFELYLTDNKGNIYRRKFSINSKGVTDITITYADLYKMGKILAF